MVTDPPQLATLAGARSRNLPWIQIADALLGLEAQSLADLNGQPWIQVAADRSDYTTNQLRRMTRVALFIRRLVADGQLKDDTILTSMRFSHLETAMRIHAFEPETALKVFRCEWIKPNYMDLLARYQELRENAPKSYSPMVAGKRAARRFQDISLSLLQEAAFLHLGPERRIGRMTHPSRYANPDFLIVTRHEGRVTRVDGVDCYALIGRSQNENAMKRVLQVATESTFFTHFWVVLPDPGYINLFRDEARLLELANVGFILVDQAKNVIVEHWSPLNYASRQEYESLWREEENKDHFYDNYGDEDCERERRFDDKESSGWLKRRRELWLEWLPLQLP